jgi:hypothetical protein
MFETFSKKFESVFRVIFIVWVCFWGVINFADLLYQYASFNNSAKQTTAELGQWWLMTFGNLVTVTLGVILLFLMSAVPRLIETHKTIKTITLMTILTCFYYLTFTMIKIFISIIYKSPEQAFRDLIGLSMWLMPSIILLIIHMFYYSNLRVYNQELAESKEIKTA